MNIAYLETPGFRGETNVTIYHTVVGNQEAEFAKYLMKNLAIVTCQSDGEDSAGRQKVRLMTPEEIVQRACDIAKSSFEEFHKRGWMMDIPAPKAPKTSKDDL